jgi:hypothetical protein
MLLIYLKTGDCIEVRDAVRAERRNESLVCLDSDGHATATFPVSEVESYTGNDFIAISMKDEVCDDVTVIEDGEVVEEAEPEPDPA